MNSTATTVEASNARGTQHAERFFVHRLRLVAGAGAVVWLSTVVFLHDVIVALLALAPLVLVPLAFSAAVQPDRNGRYPRSLGAISMLLLPAAVSLVIALSLRPGAVAGWLSIPWAATTVVIALMGLRRLAERGLRWIDEAALDLGCVFLAVGGAWVVIATSGYRPMGFSLREILLAAVHFHYAGFLLPVIGTMACRAGAGRTCRFALSGLVVGVPSVALGIAYSPFLEVVGAVLTALSAASIAAVQAWGASRWSSGRLQRTLLLGSSAALATGALFALAFVLSRSAGTDVIGQRMISLHGVVNGLGFATLGVLGWALHPPERTSPSEGIPFSRAAARWRVGPTFFQERGAVDPGRDVRGLTDSLDVFRRSGFPTERVHPAIRAFYEDTQAHTLQVVPRWTPGFRLLYRGFRLFAQRIGQNDFPLLERSPARINNEVLALKGDRPGLRAWIRTFTDAPERAMYVAEYATHRFGDVTYMDIAFPYPGGNLTSILNPNPIDVQARELGFQLTTRDGDARGDAGIWFVTRRGSVRLPLQEMINVWAPDMPGVPEPLRDQGTRTTVVARHELRMFGLRYPR